MASTISGDNGLVAPTGAVYNGIQSKTAVASTSGTSIDFTGIPSWVKRITVMFNGVSTNGTSAVQFQLGSSGGVETTSYNCTSSIQATSTMATAAYTSGFVIGIGGAGAAANTIYGAITFSLLNSNIWTASGNMGFQNLGYLVITCGAKTLSGTLDRVRITTVNGTDTFDAGSINIFYE